MKNNEIKGVYKNICQQAQMPFESNIRLNRLSDENEWVYILKAAVKQYKNSSNTLNDEVQVETAVYYFIKPFITISIKALQKKNKKIYSKLDDGCILKLEERLKTDLTNIIANLIRDLNGTNSTESSLKLVGYVVNIYEQPLQYFRKLPVLSRLLSTTVVNWVNNTNTVFERIICDYSEILKLCDVSNDSDYDSIIGSIKNIEVGLSDPHEGAQSVCVITFTGDKKVVYKPKNIDTEIYFNKFVDWVNTLDSGQEKLETPSAISKGTYGWVQYVDNIRQCGSVSEVENYYKHLGSLSAILYVLRGTDYHYDNLISSADMPYFIDHEMLCYPIYIENNPEISDSCDNVQDNIYESVLNTRIFTVDEKRQHSDIKDISAVGFYEEGKPNLHLPKLNNEYRRYHLYIDSLIKGFKETYTNISKNKQYLLNSADSPLLSFKDLHIRFNVRATSTYLTIVKSCVMPNALINGSAFCDYIHSLRVRYQSIFSNGLPLDMRLDELKMLTRLDVPRFTIKADQKALDSPAGGQYGAIFDQSGYDLVLDRVKRLSIDDMNKQVSYITPS